MAAKFALGVLGTALLGVLLMVLLAAPVLSVSDGFESASGGECGEDISWTYADGVLTISGSGPMYDHSIGGGTPWSGFADKIERAILSEGITHIGNSAFLDCVELKDINIPSTVVSIGNFAFYGCSSIEDMALPEGIQTIGIEAFRDCSSLSSIRLPDSLTKMGEYAFWSCTSMKTVSIGSSLTYTGYRPFFCCSSLEVIDVSEGNQAYLSSGGVLFDKSFTELVCYPAGKPDATYAIPEGITTIGDHSFELNEKIRHIAIPDSVCTIGLSAFDGCTSLESINIPDTVTELDNYVFFNCLSLGSIEIPDTVWRIGDSTFCNCGSLTSVIIPDSVTELFDYAFEGCTALEYISIPASVQTLGIYVLSELSLYEFTGGEEIEQYDDPIQGHVWRGSGDGKLYSGQLIEFLVDGEVYSSSYQKEGAPIVLPEDPTSEGRVFDHWDGYVDGMTAVIDRSFDAVFEEKSGSDSSSATIIIAIALTILAIAVITFYYYRSHRP